jgi:hypothetical protein
MKSKTIHSFIQQRTTGIQASAGNSFWVIIGYVFSLFGGLIGMFIGSVLMNAKKLLPGGEVVYVFNESSRKHGKIILYLGIAVLILSIFFFMSWFFLEEILFGNW